MSDESTPLLTSSHSKDDHAVVTVDQTNIDSMSVSTGKTRNGGIGKEKPST